MESCGISSESSCDNKVGFLSESASLDDKVSESDDEVEFLQMIK